MPFPDDHPVVDRAMQIRQAMLAKDAKLLNDLTREYLKAYRALKADIKALQKALAEMQPEKADLLRLAATRNLLDGVKNEIGKFANILGDQLEEAIRQEIEQAGLDAFGLVQAALPGIDLSELAVGWSWLSPRQVYTMYGFTDPQGPLYAGIRNQFGQAVADVVRDELLQGYIKGMHSTAIARLIRDAAGVGLDWALSTARTATIWSYRAAQHLTYLNNSQVVKGWIWWSARNERTCMSCINLHGSFHSLNEMMADHHMGRCLVPGTVVYGPPVEAFVSRRYDGEIIRIRTASGKLLTVTPNHPILTDRGWVAAYLLKSGDNIIGCRSDQWTATGVNPDEYQAPTPIEEIPGTLDMLDLGSVPCSAKNFHGDGKGSQVYVVWANRLLRNAVHPSLFKPGLEEPFGGGRTVLVEFFSDRDLFTRLQRKGNAANSILSNLDAAKALLSRNRSCKNAIGVDLTSALHSGDSEAGCDYVPRDAKLFSQGVLGLSGMIEPDNFIYGQEELFEARIGNALSSHSVSLDFAPQDAPGPELVNEALRTGLPSGSAYLGAFAGNVILDRVLEIEVGSFSGHVYNLQTPVGWYIANGIITHNCTVLPVTKTYAELGIDGVEEQPLVVQSGEAWFKEQSEAFQKKLMGPAKWRAWQDGAFTFDQLTKPYTSPIYGRMLREASLKEILGEKAALYYAK